MKILTITASNTGIGGASRIAMELAQAEIKAGHTVTVASGTNVPSSIPGIKIPKTKFQKFISRALANDISFFSGDELLNTEAFKQADVIHCHNLHGWYFSLKALQKIAAKKPVVWTFHDMWAITPHCAHSPANEPLVNGMYACNSLKDYPALAWNNSSSLASKKIKICAESDFTIVCPSQWLKHKVEKSHLSSKRIELIPNAVDTSIYKPSLKEEARKTFDLPADRKIVLFVAAGGLDNEFKGGNHIRTLSEMPDAPLFVIAGQEGQSTNDIRYVGTISDQHQLAKLYSAADALVMPSKAENAPLVILEAMACQLPVVAFDVGGIAEAVEHGTHGYIAKPEDTSDLYNGIKMVLTFSEEKRRQNREHILDKYSTERMVASYLSLFESVILAYTKHHDSH